MERNGWRLFYFPLFKERLDQLDEAVTKLAETDPNGFIHHPCAKLLKKVIDAVEDQVPTDPSDGKFQLGNTLGRSNRHWRRVKDRLPPRYRLFFQFSSVDHKIVYAWLNDANTLRKQDAKTDVYVVFKKMLERGKVPTDYRMLLDQSQSPD
jgi:toxin YhaV